MWLLLACFQNAASLPWFYACFGTNSAVHSAHSAHNASSAFNSDFLAWSEIEKKTSFLFHKLHFCISLWKNIVMQKTKLSRYCYTQNFYFIKIGQHQEYCYGKNYDIARIVIARIDCNWNSSLAKKSMTRVFYFQKKSSESSDHQPSLSFV